jgi:hypothetical protein
MIGWRWRWGCSRALNHGLMRKTWWLVIGVVDRWSISKLKRLQVPVKLRIENLKVVVVRDAGRRHLIELEAVRQSCVLHSADYAV